MFHSINHYVHMNVGEKSNAAARTTAKPAGERSGDWISRRIVWRSLTANNVHRE
jgi:hypothetical protein